MLKLENVSKIYYNNGIIATGFSKINLELKIGEFVVITGESGSGKSTLLNVISGLDSYEEGEMYVNGKETSHYTERDFEDYRRKYIANIFQNFNLVNSYTVYQNIELVLLLNGYKKREIKKKILDIIEQVGLTRFKNTKVSKLSGGQKQKVAIARAMVKDTPIIVADEPTGNLDTESAKDVINILKNVAQNKLVVIVTHNIEQVEQYATRIIKMNDGKIIENTQIKKLDDNIEIQESENKQINLINKCKLGIRNTFNIKTKFILLFAVFFFVASALLLEYSSFELTEASYKTEYSGIIFNDMSENRILIKKEDKTPFSQEDYDKIKAISNVDYIIENDLFVDTKINIVKNSQESTYRNINFLGSASDINNFRGNLDVGRMPTEENEIIIEISEKTYNKNTILNDVINNYFNIGDGWNSIIENLKVVGIKYYENDRNYDTKIYMSPNQLEKLRIFVNKNYSNIKTFFNNAFISNEIIPSEKVEKGTAIINSEWAYQMPDNKVKGKKMVISISNIYYTDELNLTINNTFTKSNINRLTGYSNYNKYNQNIFINKEEYESLYNKPPYQSSVYIKNIENIDETMTELKNMGINVKKVTDYARDDYYTSREITKIVKVIVTIILIFVLFFVSYFIIKIILQSRNIYYTTLRILGATYKSVRSILNIEIFIDANLAFITIIAIIKLIKNNIIKIKYLTKLVKFIGIKECLLIYIILLLMTKLIAMKVSKKIFKNTAISTYNEEV